MKLVTFSPKLQAPPRKAEQSYGRVRLIPGSNSLTDPQWEALLRNPSARADIERGAIALHIEPEPMPTPLPEPEIDPPTIPGDLNEFTVKEALPMIEGMEDVQVLEYWVLAENERSQPRTTILNAIAERIETLKETP